MWCFAKVCTRAVEWAGALSWWSWSAHSVIVNVIDTVHKLSQWCLTATWLAPRESDCSRMHSKVSSDWLTNYIKATRPVLEIFKMAGFFPDSPRILYYTELLSYLTSIFCRLQPLLWHACRCLAEWICLYDKWSDEWICLYDKWSDMKRWLIVFRENNDPLFPWYIWCNRM